VHGDLHPRNVVVRNGALAGLIDWGDLNGGDAATDVSCAWMLIADARRRREFLAAYGPGEALVCRARGWAVHLGLAHLESNEPRHTQIGLATLERVLADSS
jgi:aminoglycoside phosphotransferase (APT) family kinase protein